MQIRKQFSVAGLTAVVPFQAEIQVHPQLPWAQTTVYRAVSSAIFLLDSQELHIYSCNVTDWCSK